MKKIIVIITCLFMSIVNVKANTISNIDMDVYIDDNGNANITEVWKVYLSQGTEGYRPFNLKNQKITNFTVKDDTGVQYQTLSNWNTNLSFSDKAYKCGIHDIFGGVELCWGISKYGSRTYTLNYNISNFITQYSDTQGIYFNFLNLDQVVHNAKITIRSNHNFSLDNSRIWAFGNDGIIDFKNNNIVLNSSGKLDESQYMVALVRFENNIFNTSNNSVRSFDDIYNEAMSDVELNEKSSYETNNYNDNTSGGSAFGAYLFMLVMLPINLIIIMLVIKTICKPKEFSKIEYEIDPDKQLPNNDDINYCREIPCNKDLGYAYWTCEEYTGISTYTLKRGIIGAILLKWIKENKVTVIETDTTIFKSSKYAIDLNNISCTDNEIENDLLKILNDASGFNKILESKEFGKWCKKNYYKLNNWFNNIISIEKNKLKNMGLITTIEQENKGLFGIKYKTYKDKNDIKLKEEAIKLIGLKKFLLDFSIMPEREYKEVALWEEYLIFAHLLGIADKVEEQFKKLYPQFVEISKMNMNITTSVIREIAETGCTSADEGKKIAEERAERYSGSSRDSGGGGSSYSGGGTSSSGSSGGGFR